MRPNHLSDSISSSLFGKTRRAILGLLFTNTERDFYYREIVKLLGGGKGAISRELENLTNSGVITRTRRGNLVFYQANSGSIIFNELKSLIVKTFGVADHVKEAVLTLKDEITIAYIYGSYAKGTETHTSDIDLMIIGTVSLKNIVKALAEVQRQLDREVNPTVILKASYKKRLNDPSSFVSRVHKAEKIYLVGDESDLN